MNIMTARQYQITADPSKQHQMKLEEEEECELDTIDEEFKEPGMGGYFQNTTARKYKIITDLSTQHIQSQHPEGSVYLEQ